MYYVYPLFSAGIGRTGVFMLMETALCKMEVLEPIYPLEIVRVMRDQRGMLVQTPVSPRLCHCLAFGRCWHCWWVGIIITSVTSFK